MGDAEGLSQIVGSQSGAPTYINLKIKSQNGREVYFNVLRSSELRRVIVVSCNRLSMELSEIRFVYKGHHVLAEETPDQLRMKDGDVIDAISVQLPNQPRINVTFMSFYMGMEDVAIIDVMPNNPGCGHCHPLQ